MTRLKQAWLALCGKLEPERVEVSVEKVTERLVPVGENVVDVFWVSSKSYDSDFKLYFTRAGYGLPGKPPAKPPWSGRIYRSCAQAYAEIGSDADLTMRKAFVVGDKCYLLGSMTEHAIQPKPKRAKGRA